MVLLPNLSADLKWGTTFSKNKDHAKTFFKNELTSTYRIKPLHLFKLFRPWISEALDRVCKMEFYAVWYISLRTILVDRNPLKFHDQFYTWWLLRLHFAEEGPNSLCVFIIQKSDNLQFDMLVRWVAGTNDSSAKHLMFQVLFFFHNFFQKSFQFIFS